MSYPVAPASMIGAPEVSELRCGLKGQIDAALRKANQVAMNFDLNDKIDYSDVLFFATNIMGGAKKTGWDK